MKSKKGAIPFATTLVIFMVFILLYAWVHLYSKYNQFDKKIGERQYSLINTYQDAEKTLLFTDQSAKNALPQAIYDLAQNGGIREIEFTDSEQSETYECGKFNDAYVWFQIKKQEQVYAPTDCFNDELAAINFEYYFNNILNQFLINYPGNLLEDNYNYETMGNIEILGKPKEPLEFDIIKIGEEIEAPEITPDVQGLVDFTGTEYCTRGRRCKLKEEAYNLFVSAFDIAKERGKELEFISGYRTLRQQEALWNGETSERYAQLYPDPNERKRYVCDPREGGQGCPHLTGNAVDVTFRGKKASEMSRAEQQELHNIMAEAGWVRYGDVNNPNVGEPWHFECCGTNRYARAKERGVTAIV